MEHWLVVFVVITLYLLPTIIAYRRAHASRMGIAIINICFGWTLFGWFVAFIWALANKGASVTIYNVSR